MKSKYTEEIAKKICIDIASSNKSMVTICKEIGINYQTHLDWLRAKPEYLGMYARAKEDQADFLAEEMLTIADDSSNDDMTDEFGTRVDVGKIARAKLQIDTRKFIAAKLKPRKYGEKVEQIITTGKSLPDWMNEGGNGGKS